MLRREITRIELKPDDKEEVSHNFKASAAHCTSFCRVSAPFLQEVSLRILPAVSASQGTQIDRPCKSRFDEQGDIEQNTHRICILGAVKKLLRGFVSHGTSLQDLKGSYERTPDSRK